MLREKVKSLQCLEVQSSKECPCPNLTVTLSLDLSFPGKPGELMQDLPVSHPSWFPPGKELFMAWQEGQRNRWRGNEEKEVINGSQSLAFDQVVWSEVRGQEMR